MILTKPLLVSAVTVGLVLGGGLALQTKRLDNVREDFTEYRAASEALGRQAKLRAEEATAAAIKAKELSDAENTAAIRNLTATVSRLRKQAAAGGGLSAAAPGAGGAAQACYDPAQLAGALRRLDEGVLGLLEQGEEAITDLNTAKRWAAGR